MNDLDILNNFPTLSQKKELALKYNCNSNKIEDIKKCILIELQKIRKNKKDFSEEDIHNYILMDPPCKIKKLNEFLKNESLEFIDYLKEYYFNILKVNKIMDNNNNIIKNYLCPNDKYRIENYKNICEYLKQFDLTEIKNKKDINELFNKLIYKTIPFKETALKRIKKNSKIFYNNIPNLIIKTKSSLYKTENNKRKNLLISKIKLYESIKKYYTEDSYIQENIDKAEKEFNNNVRMLSNKIFNKGLNISKIDVITLDNDPKIFKILISDGIQTIYCRSVLAAEYSEKMITHYRFIITER